MDRTEDQLNLIEHHAAVLWESMLNKLYDRFGENFDIDPEYEDSPGFDTYLMRAIAYYHTIMHNFPIGKYDDRAHVSVMREAVDLAIKHYENYWNKPPKTIPWDDVRDF